MNENEFVLGGKKYVVVEDNDFLCVSCDDCAFRLEDCGELRKRGKIPPCSEEDRTDKKNVAFVEKIKKCSRHLLKIRKEFADAKLAGLKPWEIRSTEDRTFRVGDVVVYEVLDDPEHPLNEKEYTITFIYDGAIGLTNNYCIFTDKESGDAEAEAAQERVRAALRNRSPL